VGVGGEPAPSDRLYVNGVTRGQDRFEVIKGGANEWSKGSGFFLGDSTGDYAAMQLSAAQGIDFWLTKKGFVPARAVSFTADGKVGIGTA